MPSRKQDRVDLLPFRQALARLIDTAIDQGQHPKLAETGVPTTWTNEAFGAAVGADESTVRGWRNADAPRTPPNIIPILRELYGDSPGHAAARAAMRRAWYDAKGIPPPELPANDPRVIQAAKAFADEVPIVDLVMSQPRPDSNSLLIVPYTLRVHPDLDRRIGDAAVDIGISDVLVVVESEYWQPVAESVFRGAAHDNVGDTAVRGGARFTGPRAEPQGWINGKPMGEAPELVMEPKQDGDGPVTMSAHVPPSSFVVVPVRDDGTGEPALPVDDTKKVVLDALFSGAYQLDPRKHLIVATSRIGPPKRPE